MKKFLFTISALIVLLLGVKNACLSQSYDTLHVEELIGTYDTKYCINSNINGIVVYGEEDCNNHTWQVMWLGLTIVEETGIDSIIIYKPQETGWFDIYYDGCNISGEAFITFVSTKTNVSPFFEQIVWKRDDGHIVLDADPDGWEFDCIWSTGETTNTIEVSEPGTYSVTITDNCGSATHSVEVRDNVELYRATCDLLTNKNQVTWQITPEQAEYITSVKVYRNTTDLIATVPYTDGSFTDDIGSESTQWQYHLVGVSVEGDDCPIPSYWKRTIHLDRVQGSQGNHILQWTPYEEEEPDKESVIAYGIYDIVGGEAHHVIDVGNFTNVYAYNPADFSGYGAVAAVFANDKGLEELAFSNLTSEMLSVGENPAYKMVIYPNPSNGTFTVEGVSSLTVYNTLGQVITTSQSEDGTHSFSLRPGIYFVKSGEGMVRKVVVE